jgi:hypothetical protein
MKNNQLQDDCEEQLEIELEEGEIIIIERCDDK